MLEVMMQVHNKSFPTHHLPLSISADGMMLRRDDAEAFKISSTSTSLATLEENTFRTEKQIT